MIGAIYLDAGMDVARSRVLAWFGLARAPPGLPEATTVLREASLKVRDARRLVRETSLPALGPRVCLVRPELLGWHERRARHELYAQKLQRDNIYGLARSRTQDRNTEHKETIFRIAIGLRRPLNVFGRRADKRY